MKIEVLFPDLCNLYGDNGNVQYLAASLPEAEVVLPATWRRPGLPKSRWISFTWVPCRRQARSWPFSASCPHRQALRQYVESGKVLLATGNALELFGAYIQDGTRKIPTLGLFPCHAVRDMEQRHNSMFLGTFGDMKIVGARSQFSYSCGEVAHPFLQVTGGYGIDLKSKMEGIHYKNFFATYLLGPFWC